jgi:hypothetical protein
MTKETKAVNFIKRLNHVIRAGMINNKMPNTFEEAVVAKMLESNMRLVTPSVKTTTAISHIDTEGKTKIYMDTLNEKINELTTKIMK